MIGNQRRHGILLGKCASACYWHAVSRNLRRSCHDHCHARACMSRYAADMRVRPASLAACMSPPSMTRIQQGAKAKRLCTIASH